MAASVDLKKIVKAYGEVEVVHGVDLRIEPGEFVVFVGPSGCGKSTLLRMIAGLEPITGGALLIDGEEMNTVPAAKRGIAMVFQSYALYPHMSVYQNLAFGLETAKVPRDEIRRKVEEAARILRIEPLLQRKPKQLSGGQRQRVAIGRAITREPRIFLFDEPLSNLDAELRVQMRVEIAKLHQQLGNTMIYVTHDQVEAMTMADKIVVLSAGHIEQVGAPLDLYNHPANLFVAGFIGSPKMNILPASGDGTGAITVGGRTLALGRKGAEGEGLSFGLRPEHIGIGQRTGTAPGGGEIELGPVTVELVEHLGGQTVIYARLGDHALTIVVEGQRQLGPGESVTASFRPENAHVFDRNGAVVPGGAAKSEASAASATALK